MSRQGAEIEVTAGAAFAPALAELGAQFERSKGHRLVIQYAIADAINRMIDGDAAFDLLIARQTCSIKQPISTNFHRRR